MENEGKSIGLRKGEMQEVYNSYLMFCIKKQVPSPPSYSSDIFKEKLINKHYETTRQVHLGTHEIFMDLIKLYLAEIELNRELNKDYESRDTTVPQSAFERFIWERVNNSFKYYTTEELYPLPKSTIEARRKIENIKITLGIIITIAGLLIIFFGNYLFDL